MTTQNILNKLLNLYEGKKYKHTYVPDRTYANILHKDLCNEIKALILEDV